MLSNSKGWDPLVVGILKKVKSCLKWNLADLQVLDTWRSKSGKVVLLGDAAHACLPFVFSLKLSLTEVGTRSCNGR
jgi:2-polyprenyl-6-methoxyphenol hydroxylase-like FAD-dependent oxidoreductase